MIVTIDTYPSHADMSKPRRSGQDVGGTMTTTNKRNRNLVRGGQLIFLCLILYFLGRDMELMFQLDTSIHEEHFESPSNASIRTTTSQHLSPINLPLVIREATRTNFMSPGLMEVSQIHRTKHLKEQTEQDKQDMHSTNMPKENEFDPLDPYIEFHQPALTTIQNLINSSTIISWGGVVKKRIEEFRIKAVFSNYGLPIVPLHGKTQDDLHELWSDSNVTMDWTQASSNSTAAATISTNCSSSPYIWAATICSAARTFQKYGSKRRHVLFATCNENWGAFSDYVPGKTKDHGKKSFFFGCSEEEIFSYINNPNTRAVFTTQHQNIDHPKVHSLPLGVKYTMKDRILKTIAMPLDTVRKSQWLMINDNGWKHRKNVTATVIRNFELAAITNATVGNSSIASPRPAQQKLRNTYENKKAERYLKELQRSKFILSPSGLGWDCYRIWEALYFNTIPIVERYDRHHDGWHRSLEGLPVLWVDHFHQVTPDLLEREYKSFVLKAKQDGYYNFEKLSLSWWAQFIRNQLSDDGTSKS